MDVAYFHLYGIAREDMDYILEMYDAMASVIELGRAYETGLPPPPASVLVAHAAVVGESRV